MVFWVKIRGWEGCQTNITGGHPLREPAGRRAAGNHPAYTEPRLPGSQHLPGSLELVIRDTWLPNWTMVQLVNLFKQNVTLKSGKTKFAMLGLATSCDPSL